MTRLAVAVTQPTSVYASRGAWQDRCSLRQAARLAYATSWHLPRGTRAAHSSGDARSRTRRSRRTTTWAKASPERAHLQRSVRGQQYSTVLASPAPSPDRDCRGSMHAVGSVVLVSGRPCWSAVALPACQDPDGRRCIGARRAALTHHPPTPR